MWKLIAGFLIAVSLFVVVVASPISARTGDLLMFPAATIMNSLPGGKENPLNLLIVVALQALVYAGVLQIITKTWNYFKQGN